MMEKSKNKRKKQCVKGKLSKSVHMLIKDRDHFQLRASFYGHQCWQWIAQRNWNKDEDSSERRMRKWKYNNKEHIKMRYILKNLLLMLTGSEKQQRVTMEKCILNSP